MSESIWYSVDPGSVHTGVCTWDGVQVVESRELRPQEFTEWVSAMIISALTGGGRPARIVAEEFRLEPARATALAGSTLGVVRQLGALELFCWLSSTPLVLQPNKVLNPAKGLARARGWAYHTRDGSEHARDAERHGLYFLVREGLI